MFGDISLLHGLSCGPQVNSVYAKRSWSQIVNLVE
jgi:hypothetical protein